MPEQATTVQSAFSRRGVLRSAAWSVPAVTLAAGVPAYAVSGGEVLPAALAVDYPNYWAPTQAELEAAGFDPSDFRLPMEGLVVGIMAYNSGTTTLPLAVTLRPPLWTNGAAPTPFLWTNAGQAGLWSIDQPSDVSEGTAGLSPNGELVFSLPGGLEPGANAALAVIYDTEGVLPLRTPSSWSARVGSPPILGSFAQVPTQSFTEYWDEVNGGGAQEGLRAARRAPFDASTLLLRPSGRATR